MKFSAEICNLNRTQRKQKPKLSGLD